LGILGGVRIGDDTLFQRVSVGGTFDGLHYGHRKLLTLAVSSVDPLSGSLLVGVTSDEMLTKKKLSRLIPPLSERIESVRKFLDKLSPGLKNRRKIVAINDTFGPPGRDKDFDALVLSHETLPTGHELNERRASMGLPKLKLLCTRRTEPNSMSSTALRRLRDRKQSQQML
jgi:cytidyltransferase-like protein